MQKIASFLFLLIITSFATEAQTKKKKKKEKAPVPIEKIVKFETLEHDFGNIVEGGKVSFEFKYKNLSRKPLVLQSVYASCGCTIPSWSKEPLKRRKWNKITVTYNTKGRPGVFRKRVTVQTNQGVQYLHIKGVVKRAAKK